MGAPPLPSLYLTLGRQLAQVLGSNLQETSAEALRDLARVYDPSAHEARINAEVFLLHKYLLVQACVGTFPESETEQVVAGFFAALNERADGLEFNSERQVAMERMWRLRAGQFDQPFAQDRERFLDESSGPLQWKHTIDQFCQNVCQLDRPPDIWSGSGGPSHRASRSVTEILDKMLSAVGEMSRQHFA
jgi:hypothetical protein